MPEALIISKRVMEQVKYIEHKWNDFHDIHLPSDVEPHNVAYAKNAFYAGANAFGDIALDESRGPEILGVKAVSRLWEKITGWQNR